MGNSLIERLAAAPAVGVDFRPYSLSPDGTTLAFQWYNGGDWQIYLMPLGGGEPRRVAALDDACWCPIFSPDGRYLYFARDDRGSECYDVYRYALADGGLENLLPDTPELAPLPDFDLSPDGARIAMTVSHDSGYSVAVMPAAPCPGAEGLEHLSQHPYTENSPRWSPDGRHLAVSAGTRGQDTAVFVIDAATGERSLVGNDERFFARMPARSPDGTRLAFSGGPADHPAIGIYDLVTATISWAWEGPFDAHHPAWAPDGSGLVFLLDADAETGLAYLDLRSGEIAELSVGPGNHYHPSFTADSASVLCVLSGPDHPADLYLVDLADGDATRVTDSLPADLRDHPFTGGISVHFTSWDHLSEVPGLLVEPPEPCGAGVVIIHGGPTWHHANEWDALRQALTAAGVTVVHPNYRGSDGYGRRWQLANRYLMGQGEALDVVAAHELLVSLGCDPERIAVTGRSWGGFLTMAMLTQFPDLWAAGVAGVPFFDFIDSQTDTDIRADLRWWDQQNTGDIVADRARLEHYSPINHLARVRASLLLLGGQFDPRCPPKQIAEVAARLRAQGTVCDAVVYENEGHEITGLEHRVDYDRRTAEFILAHIGGSG